jgi:hypothetical protein
MTPTLREVSRMTDVLAVLSTHGATGGLRDRLDACRTPAALAYRLAQDFMSLEMVDHGIDFGERFRRLARIGDLKAAGRRYHNCLRKMPPYLVSRCLAGQSVMLEFDTRTETGVLVQLDVVSPHVRPLLVRIESILGPGNEQPAPAIEEDVRRLLRSVPGMRVVHRELHECLAPIFERVSRGSDLEEIAHLRADRREVGPDELVAL